MKATLRRITPGVLLLLSCSGGVRAQEATAKRNLVVLNLAAMLFITPESLDAVLTL